MIAIMMLVAMTMALPLAALAVAPAVEATSVHASPWAGAAGIERITTPLERVAFGSCNHQDRPQPLWSPILATEPQLWLWMGDAVYGDYRAFNELRTYLPPFPFFRDAPPEMLVDKYSNQLAVPAYKDLRAQVPVIGVWDDHDYGRNDGGEIYPYRRESQQIFLDFLGEPASSPRRAQRGIYASYDLGHGEHSVRFILLDGRFNKDPYNTTDGDFLGDEQWSWFETQLLSSTAAFNVIVSGIQILPDDRFLGGESWHRFPGQRERLLDLVLRSRARGVILLSGDVHFAEINQVQCNDYHNILTEITSSGMTHSWDKPSAFATVHAFLFRSANLLLPWAFRPHRDSYFGLTNFGTITFDWTSDPLPTATVRVHGEDGESKLEHVFSSRFIEPDDRTPHPGKTCRPIREGEPIVTTLRRGLLVTWIVLLVGGFLGAALGLVFAAVGLFRWALHLMLGLQRRLFDHGYEKLD